MSNLFEVIDGIHANAAECVEKGISTHRVSDERFRSFATAVREFEMHLRDTAILDNWANYLGYLKMFRLRYATTPISASELCKSTRIRGDSLSLPRLLASADPSTLAQFNAVDEAFKKLQTASLNPLWIQFLQRFEFDFTLKSDRRRIGIVCYWNDLFGTIDSLVQGASGPRWRIPFAVKASQLKYQNICDEIVIFGSLRWLEKRGWSYLFEAPRCRSISTYCFNDIPDYQPDFYRLAGSPHNFKRASHLGPRFVHGGFTVSHAQTETEPDFASPQNDVSKTLDEMLPSLDLDRVSVKGGSTSDSESAEMIDAHLVELSGASGVWLNPEGIVYRLELTGAGRAIRCLRVSHVAVSDILSGDALIFSTAGGGSMISEEADLMMGERAKEARQNQFFWKKRLADWVKQVGCESVCQSLRASGVSIASQQNLRNWTNPDNIAPGDPEHFKIILSNCGLQPETEKILKATALIRKAHRAAGFFLSRKLFRMIRGQSLMELATSGCQVFGGDELIASEKTAFFVESISSDTKAIPSSELSKPFRLEGDLWR